MTSITNVVIFHDDTNGMYNNVKIQSCFPVKHWITFFAETKNIFLDIGSFVLRRSVNHIMLNIEEKKSYEIRRLIEKFTADQIKNFVIFGRLVWGLWKYWTKLQKSYPRIEFIKKVHKSFDTRHQEKNLGNISFIFISNVSDGSNPNFYYIYIMKNCLGIYSSLWYLCHEDKKGKVSIGIFVVLFFNRFFYSSGFAGYTKYGRTQSYRHWDFLL